MGKPKVEKFESNYTDMCGECKTEGKVFVETDYNYHHGESKGYWETCPLCEGSGLVLVNKKTVVTITAKKLKGCSKDE